ncbi:MAG: hypothetical protein KAG99_04570 [Bacteroidales bacterium]|nr:hypothetical protein [Bacteroidales bacterium]
MEIKYTLEILAKDIQDIGKLVENLHNSPDGSSLELDLALSKLRNVYDVLNEIRTDISIQARTQPVHEAQPVLEAPPVLEEPVRDEEPEKPLPQAQVDTEPEAVAELIKEKDSGTVAEKFAVKSSINENMAGTRDQEEESKLVGPPIDNIGRNIGINDRFLIIRELFDGDSDGFGKLIRDLDSADSIHDANERLSTQFEDSPNHEGIGILSILVKRRFSQI